MPPENELQTPEVQPDPVPADQTALDSTTIPPAPVTETVSEPEPAPVPPQPTDSGNSGAQDGQNGTPADAQVPQDEVSAPPAELNPENPAPEAPQEAKDEAQTAQDVQDTVETAQTVPLARLQGVQRVLSQVERDRDSLKNMLTTVQQELTQANTRAATEYAERLRTTQRDIVPDLIRGETIEQVDASLSASRAAFAAARQAYARTIPTPQPGASNPPAGQPPAQQTPGSPIQMISQGLRQSSNDINR